MHDTTSLARICMAGMQKSLGSKGAAVLDEAARRRRRTIRWPEDSGRLTEITPSPQRLLHRREKNGLLYSAGDNRFVIALPGTMSLQQAASAELLADLAFRPRGDYYVGFLSGLVAHRLTDLHSGTTYVAMREGTNEIERVRFSDSKEFFYRSSIERTLVDCLLRPDLSGGIETVVTAWARAKMQPEVRWDQVAEIAERISDAAFRRAVFLLCLLGFDALVESRLPPIEGRKSSPIFDRSRGFDLPKDQERRDPQTGVRVNVPVDYLRGWIPGASMG